MENGFSFTDDRSSFVGNYVSFTGRADEFRVTDARNGGVVVRPKYEWRWAERLLVEWEDRVWWPIRRAWRRL